ncbi:hypothetical protein L2E82_24867 [Cichorium intybus]|uniref:Uncharacterized protein n=1 Tax=Cichorium intybus TaxID=13427 RepID=A0ACB9E1F4_CICIN|nr:hypothetical protein L2E82_24867 [Cichorium intybus]
MSKVIVGRIRYHSSSFFLLVSIDEIRYLLVVHIYTCSSIKSEIIRFFVAEICYLKSEIINYVLHLDEIRILVAEVELFDSLIGKDRVFYLEKLVVKFCLPGPTRSQASSKGVLEMPKNFEGPKFCPSNIRHKVVSWIDCGDEGAKTLAPNEHIETTYSVTTSPL